MIDGITGAMIMMEYVEMARLTPYLTLCGEFHMWPIGVVVAAKWWNSLPSDLQGILADQLQGAMNTYKAQAIAKQDYWLDYFKNYAGTTVTVMSETEKNRCRAAVKPVRDELAKDPNLNTILAAADATR
jgi:TRAP-type C4-dicarboxylate transport system substrate-binding protein